jgi:hypothetical protein
MMVSEGLTHVQASVFCTATFRNADVLRRLLRFLAERTLSGEGEQLKEYAIGIDAPGKPATYDPRHDSVVRIQFGLSASCCQESWLLR